MKVFSRKSRNTLDETNSDFKTNHLQRNDTLFLENYEGRERYYCHCFNNLFLACHIFRKKCGDGRVFYDPVQTPD
jgi:hypothetical protein